jgi:hypothetical protein
MSFRWLAHEVSYREVAYGSVSGIRLVDARRAGFSDPAYFLGFTL